jgi:hypothetical protein
MIRAIKYKPILWRPRIMADLPMLPQEMGISKDSCQRFIYVVKR